MSSPEFLERRLNRMLSQPPTIRAAGSVIVSMTAITVVAGGVLVRVVDAKEFPNVWLGMWWSLQTVTTVGYGDIVPSATTGRIIGVLIMLQGIAFLTIVTAVITSTFIERARRQGGIDSSRQLDETLRSIEERLHRIEQRLER
jgi:voltage-gated potassium channel Kch